MLKQILTTSKRWIACSVGLLSLSLTTQAQLANGFWATMEYTNEGQGSIVAFSVPGLSINSIYQFKSILSDGDDPFGNNLVEGPDGYLYGMTSQGGYQGYGNFFKLKKDGSDYKILKEFSYFTDGAYPYGKLLKSSDGFLYGIMYEGGNSADYGTIYQIDYNGNMRILRHLKQTDGAYAYGGLIEHQEYLYGTTYEEGPFEAGTVFRIKKDGTDFKVLHAFEDSDTDGGYPYFNDPVIVNNKLYGMTYSGGSDGKGTIYRVNLDGTMYEKLYDFNSDNINGYYPYSPLYVGSDGFIYGTTESGGYNGDGTIFRFSTSSLVNNTATGTSTLLGVEFVHDLEYNVLGGGPEGYPLKFSSNGDVYVITPDGGVDDVGVLSKFNINSVTAFPSTFIGIRTISGFTILRELSESIGGNTFGELLESGNDLFGISSSNNGHIYKISKNGVSAENLYTFYSSLGSYPIGGVVKHPNGKIYGVTREGGYKGYGTIFSIDTESKFKTEFNFSNTSQHGNYPRGLTLAPDGNIYFITYQGGTYGYGLLAQFDPSSKQVTQLVNLAWSGNTGAYPRTEGGLSTLPGNRLVYTTDYYNGTYGGGVIIVSLSGTNLTTAGVVATAPTTNNVTTGRLANRPVYNEQDGLLYFSTYEGGTSGGGVLAVMTINGGSGFAKFHDFTGNVGSNGIAIVNHTIFGMTNSGGSNGYGIIYKFNISTSGFSVISNLQSSSEGIGVYPTNQYFTIGNDGYLYGSTRSGAKFSNGAFFRMEINSNTLGGHNIERLANIEPQKGYSHSGGLIYGSYCANAPSVTMLQDRVSVCSQNALTFNPFEISGLPTGYEWYKNESVVSGASAQALSFASLSTTDAGEYKLRAFNSCASFTSDPVVLQVNESIISTTTLAGATIAVCKFAEFGIPVETRGPIKSVKWYKDGVQLPFNGTFLGFNAFGAKDAGVYKVEFINDCNTLVIDNITLTLDTATCISSVGNESNAGVSIYPNPNSGTFTVRSAISATITVLDMSGSVVHAVAVNPLSATSVETGLAAGVYVVKITTATGVKTQKLVIE